MGVGATEVATGRHLYMALGLVEGRVLRPAQPFHLPRARATGQWVQFQVYGSIGKEGFLVSVHVTHARVVRNRRRYQLRGLLLAFDAIKVF